MLINKRSKFVLVGVVIFSMIATYGYGFSVEAASLDSAKVLLSDSDRGVTATSTITFEMGDANFLTGGQYVRVHYDPDNGAFGDPGAATVTCPAETTAASTTVGVDFIECVIDAGEFLESTTTKEIVVVGLDNPNPGVGTAYDIYVSTHQADGTEIELTEVKVFILDDVTVRAHVDATLSFAVSALGPYSTTNTVNGIDLTGTSTSNELSFGDLSLSASSTMGHELTVTTNASDGYSVTVQQTSELVSGAGDNINSFNNSPDNTGSSTPVVWDGPRGILGQTFTYGHMGVTTEDNSLSSLDFTSSRYVGINHLDPLEIMYHGQPADGTTADVGLSAVAYTIEINELQEAGDYETTLTYVCTATY